MGKSNIDIGKMDKRITLQKYNKALDKTQTNSKGFPIKEDDSGWKDFKTVWSNVNGLYGREFYAAKAINEENTMNFIIRYSSDIEDLDSKLYRIIYKSKTYDITFVDNVNESNTFYKIKAQVVS